MIEFRQVSKTYPGSQSPVVTDLSFEVLEGEICVLVGPSGCGKTTTMRMVNRLIEITEGEILIDGEPNTAMSATRLRRKIGYAIQQIGLFPHRTIAVNIGTVPHLLGWDKGRIRDRVDELLELVGLSQRSTATATRPSSRAAAATRRGRAGAGGGPSDHADGRAVRGRRPDHARAAPGRVLADPGGHKEDHRLRHPRHRRGHKDGEQDRHPQAGRRPRPVRHPENILSRPDSEFVSRSWAQTGSSSGSP